MKLPKLSPSSIGALVKQHAMPKHVAEGQAALRAAFKSPTANPALQESRLAARKRAIARESAELELRRKKKMTTPRHLQW